MPFKGLPWVAFGGDARGRDNLLVSKGSSMVLKYGPLDLVK